jgi:hypothetical protein
MIETIAPPAPPMEHPEADTVNPVTPGTDTVKVTGTPCVLVDGPVSVKPPDVQVCCAGAISAEITDTVKALLITLPPGALRIVIV